MTTQESINKKNGEINDQKISLKRSDYKARKNSEAVIKWLIANHPEIAEILPYPSLMDEADTQRADINTLEAEVVQLEAQLKEEELEAENIGHTGEGEQP